MDGNLAKGMNFLKVIGFCTKVQDSFLSYYFISDFASFYKGFLLYKVCLQKTCQENLFHFEKLVFIVLLTF